MQLSRSSNHLKHNFIPKKNNQIHHDLVQMNNNSQMEQSTRMLGSMNLGTVILSHVESQQAAIRESAKWDSGNSPWTKERRKAFPGFKEAKKTR